MHTGFCLVSDLEPKGDQPKAIEGLVCGIERGLRDQVLLGATGSGSTATTIRPRVFEAAL